VLSEPPGLRIDLLTDARDSVLRLRGELDPDTARLLTTDAEQMVLGGRRHLVLDCAGVTFCDSFGLRAMLQLWNRVQPDGSVTIDRPSATLVRILEITGLIELFQVPVIPN
jgi:anti-anti-sigma factor